MSYFCQLLMKRIVFAFLLITLFSACSNQFAKVVKSKDIEYKFKMAQQYYAKGKYQYAQQLFEDLFPYIKGTQRYEDMYYKYAYSMYYQKDYMNAENLFKAFIETFPNSAKAEECEYMRAYSFYKQSPKVDLDQVPTTKTIALMQAFINGHQGSSRVKEATEIIDKCRAKLEEKDFKAAQLYYNLGFFKAAAISYASLMENFPDSDKSPEYKLWVIKSYFKYAEMSIEEKQAERFEKVLSECEDFVDRYPESKLKQEVSKYKSQSSDLINKAKYEQAKKATQR